MSEGNKSELERLLGIANNYSDDTDIGLWLDKCDVLEIKKGFKKKIVGKGLISAEKIIRNFEIGNIYPEVLEAEVIMEKKTKERYKQEYYRHA